MSRRGAARTTAEPELASSAALPTEAASAAADSRRAPSARRPYLDWLRGLGVLIMIEGHALDAWTRLDQRDHDGYELAILVAGFGAPLFLFLAGISLSLAAGSRSRKGLSRREIAEAAIRRGAWILLLAYLFRLQSWAISGGAFPWSLFKVDILNVMGVSMMLAAALWGLGAGRLPRAVMLGAATVIAAMATPVVRGVEALGVVPDALEGYLRPPAGSGAFTLFPWAGFLVAGAAFGLWLDATKAGETLERRAVVAMTLAGLAIAAIGYGTSFLPPLYENSSFWTSSPTFFFVRLGVVIAAMGLGAMLATAPGGGALQEFGRASLFVYWIHVEMAYGVLSTPLHRRLSFEGSVVAIVLFGLLLFGLVRLKARWAAGAGFGKRLAVQHLR